MARLLVAVADPLDGDLAQVVERCPAVVGMETVQDQCGVGVVGFLNDPPRLAYVADRAEEAETRILFNRDLGSIHLSGKTDYQVILYLTPGDFFTGCFFHILLSYLKMPEP